MKNNFAGVIALGNEANDLSALRNYQGADLLFGHALERVEHGGIGLDAPYIISFDL